MADIDRHLSRTLAPPDAAYHATPRSQVQSPRRRSNSITEPRWPTWSLDRFRGCMSGAEVGEAISPPASRLHGPMLGSFGSIGEDRCSSMLKSGVFGEGAKASTAAAASRSRSHMHCLPPADGCGVRGRGRGRHPRRVPHGARDAWRRGVGDVKRCKAYRSARALRAGLSGLRGLRQTRGLAAADAAPGRTSSQLAVRDHGHA
jgi:hypothetical protein